jgi:phosphoglycerol transferase
VFICLVLVFGVLDQTSESFAPSYASIKAEYLNDETFVNNIEAIMPENAMIYQLPYVPFPEYPPVNKMTDYSHFRAYLHSKDLRWSYGVLKGRPGDDWQRMVASMPIEDMLWTMSQTGFKGIYIDSYGFKDSGAKLVSEIKQFLRTEPLVSGNQRLYFFDITEYNRKMKANSSENKKITMALASGWHDQENPHRWMKEDGDIFVYSNLDCTANLSLQTFSFYRPRTLEVSMGDELEEQVVVPTNLFNLTVPVRLAKGANIVHLHVLEGCENPSDINELNSHDDRCLSVAVQNLIVT